MPNKDCPIHQLDCHCFESILVLPLMYLHKDIEVEEDLVDGVDERLVHEGLAVVVDLGHLENTDFA